jgi:UDP-GlcNAc3NAcA epimerase
MKIITILGARPQFIKAAAVSRAIEAYNRDVIPIIQETVIHTGQHFDGNMSDIFFNELGIGKPAYHLDIHGGSHGEMTGRMLIEIEKVLQKEKPDVVMVYGDTNSTLAGALAAVKMHIPVAHVEAGLRSFNIEMPEEVNRILVDRVSRWLFTPTTLAAQNLAREGFAVEQIIPVGDVMYDVALFHVSQVNKHSGTLDKLEANYGIKAGNYVLATIHRAENTDSIQRLKCIFDALLEFSKEVPVVLPLHPRTRKILLSCDSLSTIQDSKSLILIDPVGYMDMVQLEKNSLMIATDSGGVQKEAFFYEVPCVTLRGETEWVELVEAGWNRLAPPTDYALLLSVLRTSLHSRGEVVKPYGDGNAAKYIVESLVAGF